MLLLVYMLCAFAQLTRFPPVVSTQAFPPPVCFLSSLALLLFYLTLSLSFAFTFSNKPEFFIYYG